jgi:hypothetical protein
MHYARFCPEPRTLNPAASAFASLFIRCGEAGAFRPLSLGPSCLHGGEKE